MLNALLYNKQNEDEVLNMDDIVLKDYNGIMVLRDDLLRGGTKSVLLEKILPPEYDEYVYATPVYGGFQIALSEYCKAHGKRATLFCASRKVLHPNTTRLLENGSNVVFVKPGYMSVVEKHARDYCLENNAYKLPFGADTPVARSILKQRVENVISKCPLVENIWCAVGSGTLVRSILAATEGSNIHVHGVQVGKEFDGEHTRLSIYPYHRPFEAECKFNAEFPSMKNYDLKAYEYCVESDTKNKLFWNVL